MKNFEERCIELDIRLIKQCIQKLNQGNRRRPRNHFFKYVPKVSPKCNKLNVTTTEILATCKNTKIFYHRLRKDFWDIRCEQCKTTRILPFKPNNIT